MNVAVRYYTRGGNTKKVADAIAGELGVEALDITNEVKDADVLFIGASMYAFKVDKNIKDFVNNLKQENAKKIAVFSTSASDTSTHKKIKKCIKDKSIVIIDEYFSAPGAFLKMNKGRPNDTDLDNAKKFATEVVKKYS